MSLPKCDAQRRPPPGPRMTSSAYYPEGVLLEDVPCPHRCPPSDEPVLEGHDRLNGVPGRFRVVRCRHCGLMRTNPRPTSETIGVYYPDTYAPYQSVATGTPPVKVRRWHHRVKERIHRFLGHDMRRLPPIEPGHMIEIGCASGDYLLQMQALGWSTEGIEFSESAAVKARASGLQVQQATVENAEPPMQQADVVAAWMVLEHLHQPVEALQKVRTWVKPEGYLVGVVPDADAWDRKIFGPYWYALHLPAHLFHYTPRSLRRLFAEAGWDLVHLRWQANANHLLNSLESWLQDQQRPRALKWVRWLKNDPSRRAHKMRRRLHWLLGVTHQSGRMEFWARPSTQPRTEP